LVPKPIYQNPGERRKTNGKQEKGVLWLWKIERVEPRKSRTPVDGEYEPERCGVPQIDNVDLDHFLVCLRLALIKLV